MDKAFFGTARFGDYTRFSVYRPDWDRLVKRVEAVAGSISTDVTRRRLSLGDNASRDSVTGWRPKSWLETTIEMIIDSTASGSIATVVGTYIRTGALGLSADPVVVGDEVKDASGTYYEVKSLRPRKIGDSFIRYDSDLTHLPLHVDTATASQPASPEDARSRTKTFIETYVTDSSAVKPVMFAFPDYPLVKEFFASSDPATGVFAVGEATTTGRIGVRYTEHLPIHIVAVDKHGLSGTKMVQHMENVLRYALEAHPTGSLWALDRRTDTTQRFGSTTLYDREFVMGYRRTSARGMA